MNSRDRVLQEVKMYQSNDWDLAEETPDYFVMKRNKSTTLGHILVFVFFWWTLGLANLLYWLAGKQTKKLVK